MKALIAHLFRAEPRGAVVLLAASALWAYGSMLSRRLRLPPAPQTPSMPLTS